MRKILHTATAMGIKKFYIIETWKVEKSYWNSPLLHAENIKKECILGLEQAGDTQLPEIEIRRRFKPFAEDELPLLAKNRHCFFAHPAKTKLIPRNTRKPQLLAIGPEGGFTEYETVKLTDAGLEQISLGSRPLRSEFAVTAILALLENI
jgi:RsmE family RNA methyltransferase